MPLLGDHSPHVILGISMILSIVYHMHCVYVFIANNRWGKIDERQLVSLKGPLSRIRASGWVWMDLFEIYLKKNREMHYFPKK